MKRLVFIALIIGMSSFLIYGIDYSIGIGMSSAEFMALADLGYEKIAAAGFGFNTNIYLGGDVALLLDFTVGFVPLLFEIADVPVDDIGVGRLMTIDEMIGLGFRLKLGPTLSILVGFGLHAFFVWHEGMNEYYTSTDIYFDMGAGADLVLVSRLSESVCAYVSGRIAFDFVNGLLNDESTSVLSGLCGGIAVGITFPDFGVPQSGTGL